jgi:hypothetical protein
MRKIITFGGLALASLLPLSAMGNRNSESAWTGTVTAMNTDANTLTAQTWWHSKQFYVGSDCAISTPEKAKASLKDLRGGEKIRVYYQSQGALRIADRIEVQTRHLTGTVLAVDPKDRMLTLDDKLQHRTFRVSKNCRVILWNEKEGKLADLALGSRVSVTYDEPGAPPKAYVIQEQSRTTASLP